MTQKLRRTKTRRVQVAALLDAYRDDTLHLVPQGDRFIHRNDGTQCNCNPRVEPKTFADLPEWVWDELENFEHLKKDQALIVVYHMSDISRPNVPTGISD